MKIIETERLILREYRLDDFNDLAMVIGDKETMKYYDKPYDEQGINRWLNWNIESYKKNGFGLWAIELKSTGTFIGDCGITFQNIDNEILPEVGYHLNKNYHRMGYAKEAGKAVIKWAFENTNFTKLYSYMTADNTPSYKTALSIGMKYLKEYDDDGVKHYVCMIEKETKL